MPPTFDKIVPEPVIPKIVEKSKLVIMEPPVVKLETKVVREKMQKEEKSNLLDKTFSSI